MIFFPFPIQSADFFKASGKNQGDVYKLIEILPKMTIVYTSGNTGPRLGRSGGHNCSKCEGQIPPDIIMCASTETTTLLYTRSGKWFGFGENHNEELGIRGIFSNITELQHLENVRPVFFAGGDKTFVIVEEDGSVHILDNSLGLSNPKITFEEPIIKAAIGKEGIALITSSGNTALFSKLGRLNWRKVSLGEPIIDAGVGWHHVVYVTASGKVYGYGSSGLSRVIDGSTPQLIEIPDKIICCFAFSNVTYLVAETGNYWFGGSNYHGRSGSGEDSNHDNFIMCKKFTDSPIINIAGGNGHSYLLTEDGEMYSAGDSYERLLLTSSNSDRSVFETCDLVPTPVTWCSANLFVGIAVSGSLDRLWTNGYGVNLSRPRKTVILE